MDRPSESSGVSAVDEHGKPATHLLSSGWSAYVNLLTHPCGVEMLKSARRGWKKLLRDERRARREAPAARLLEPNAFVDVPALKCPECPAGIVICVTSWCPTTGEPHDWLVSCFEEDDDESFEHRHFQSDWQPVIDEAEAWAKAQSFRVPEARR